MQLRIEENELEYLPRLWTFLLLIVVNADSIVIIQHRCFNLFPKNDLENDPRWRHHVVLVQFSPTRNP